MSEKPTPTLPMFSARAIVKINASEEAGDTRVFFPHRITLDKRHYPCCRHWCRKSDSWQPTENACPEGTHDELGCSAFVVNANSNQPWKRVRKHHDATRQPQVKLTLRARGEIARQIWLQTNLDALLIIEGHITTSFNHGRFWQAFNVTYIREVTEDMMRSQLATVTFNRYRDSLIREGHALPNAGPLESPDEKPMPHWRRPTL